MSGLHKNLIVLPYTWVTEGIDTSVKPTVVLRLGEITFALREISKNFVGKRRRELH